MKDKAEFVFWPHGKQIKCARNGAFLVIVVVKCHKLWYNIFTKEKKVNQ